MHVILFKMQAPRDALQLAKESGVWSHVTRHQWKHSKRRDNQAGGEPCLVVQMEWTRQEISAKEKYRCECKKIDGSHA